MKLRQIIDAMGQPREMASRDGKTWFSRPASQLAWERRRIETPKLTDRERAWIDQVSDWPAAAVRFHYGAKPQVD